MTNPMTPPIAQSTGPQALCKLQAHVLLAGNTLYLDTGKEQDTVLFYDADGSVHVRHASGVRDTGQWTLLDDGSYSIDWANGPKNSCSRLHWQAGNIQIRDLADTPRGRVVKIVPGTVPELA
jgi:hypothetical protein